jgi:hypothetical protein
MDPQVVLAIVLAVALAYIVSVHKQPVLLTRLKEKYSALLAYMREYNKDPRWKALKQRAILTGLLEHDSSKGAIAFNVNKGYEICICVRGKDVNAAMYVLIHELAHMTVSEYDHTKNFWKNFKDLKQLCGNIGIFDTKAKNTTYCGDTVPIS